MDKLELTIEERYQLLRLLNKVKDEAIIKIGDRYFKIR